MAVKAAAQAAAALETLVAPGESLVSGPAATLKVTLIGLGCRGLGFQTGSIKNDLAIVAVEAS